MSESPSGTQVVRYPLDRALNLTSDQGEPVTVWAREVSLGRTDRELVSCELVVALTADTLRTLFAHPLIDGDLIDGSPGDADLLATLSLDPEQLDLAPANAARLSAALHSSGPLSATSSWRVIHARPHPAPDTN